MNIQDEIKNRILVLDGAMGSLIQKFKLSESDFRGQRFVKHVIDLKGNNDLLNLTKPEVISEIHEHYLIAGADIIETNTFNSNSISMSDYKLENFVYEMNVEGARIAKEAAQRYTFKNNNKPRFVAGSIGPTNRTASMSPDVNDPGYRAVNFDMLASAYEEQIKGLIVGGVDLLLIETVFDTLNCKAAIFAAENCFLKMNVRIPIMVSFTITDASGRTLSGQTPEAFYTSVSHANLFSIGINCAFGARKMKNYVKLLSDIADCNVSAYPNAGLPNEFGNYDESPEVMAENVREFLEDGIVNIIGGCCGTTPEHIKQIADLVSNYKPRRIPELKKYTCLSGLETLTIYPDSNFINIGERTNVAGSAKFARLIREENYEEAISVARQQIEGGALIIDINMDDAMINAREAMVRFLNLIAAEPEISKVPFMIDSSDWNVIEAALKCIQGKSIVNSISLKDGEEMFIEKARKIKNYGAAAIVMAFDENGQAVTYHKKIEICERSYKILTERVGLHPQDIIFDPNILTVATGMEEHNNYAVDYLNAVSWIKENLKGCLVSGGLSNLSFAFRGNNAVREAMNSIFLYHAIKAGMNMGIVNAGMIQVYDDIPVELLNLIENVLFNRHPGATEKLIDYAHNVVRATGKAKMEEQWRSFEVDDRLGYAIIHGIVKHIDEDIDEALKKYITALKVIEIPLMNGMKKVGELFGSGKMFLPQVVKSARVMKKAVSVLLPYVEADKASGNTSSGKILLATVKGDVHDIGKNIASVVLACNNYEIIDLGVMTSCDKIIQTAIEQKVDIIGLSGLITPSLDEMIVVAKEMEKHHLKIPLIIGGATTSGIHTAVKIQPEYSGLVIHVSDASQGVNVCNQLMKNYETFSLEHKTDYNNLREEYFKNQMKKHFLTIEEARKNKWKTDWYKAQITKPSLIGSKVFLDYPIKEISKYIDWNRFFKIWELNGHYPEILSDCKYGSEATKMFSDANEMINEVVNGNLLSARAVIGIFEANAINDDDILIKATNTNNQTTLHFLRQQLIKSNNMPSFCLADFIAPLESGRVDYIGAFAVSVGFGTQELENAYKKRNDNYKALMIRILSDLLSEAFIELIHEKVRKEYWGYAKDENLTIQQILSEKYTGIRPAPGYPACPDHTEKRTLFDLLKVEETIGITLTENYFMVPESSVSGWFFANPEAKYIAVSKISHDQIEDYAKRKSMTIEEAGKWLSQNLFY